MARMYISNREQNYLQFGAKTLMVHYSKSEVCKQHIRLGNCLP